MDRTEKLVEGFLQSLGLSDIVYEPDGNVPPDFLIGGTIAVEARRLNQLHTDVSGKVVGLEQADVPLWRTMTKVVHGFECANRPPTTYGIFYHFGRPIPPQTVVTKDVTSELEAFIAGDRVTPFKVSLPCGIQLHIFDWKMDKGTAFRIAGSLDQQSGGYVVGNLQAALQFAILEKEAKVAPYRAGYKDWWLVLIDFVSWGTDENDRRQLFSGWGVQHDFDKVFVVNPQDLADYFEI